MTPEIEALINELHETVTRQEMQLAEMLFEAERVGETMAALRSKLTKQKAHSQRLQMSLDSAREYIIALGGTNQIV